MHIFIDESGQFIPLGGAKTRAAAMLALVVPSSSRVALGHAFRKLKKQLGARGSEIKGSSLSESQAARVISLLQAYEVIVEAVVLDVGAHSTDEIADYKARQTEKLMEHITRDHQPGLIQDLIALQEDMRKLPNQLFLQVLCMWQLVPRLVETATMYYSQRQPVELGSFVWRIDAKGASVTVMEKVWTTLIGPLITAKSMSTPMTMVPGADYSYYDRFDTNAPDGTLPQPGHYYTDMKKVLRQDFSFISSKSDLGVQIADILASILTRGLNGKLGRAGWETLGSLFIRRREQTLRLIAPSWNAADAEVHHVTDPHWIAFVRQLDAHARSMLTRRSLQLAREDSP